MKVTARVLFDNIFKELIYHIDEGNIKAGSEQERNFLEIAAFNAIKNLCIVNSIDAPCQIKIKTNKDDLEQLIFEIDDVTTQELKKHKLLS